MPLKFFADSKVNSFRFQYEFSFISKSTSEGHLFNLQQIVKWIPFNFLCIPLRALRESSSISLRFPSELKDPSMFLRFLYRFQREALSIFIRFQGEFSLCFLRLHMELPWISRGFPSISKGSPFQFHYFSLRESKNEEMSL